jgi:ABC-2 type transport system permease protein
MIGNQLALLKRELWEHRSIYVAPAVIALLVALMAITGQVTVSTHDEAVKFFALGASNISEAHRAAMLSGIMWGVGALFVISMLILIVFYTLDTLYAERKDRSILFWRSLPVTDTETVVSKLLTAMLVIPLKTVAAVIVTHVIVLACASIWVASLGGDAWHLIWSAAPFAGTWPAMLAFFLALPLWLSPFVGWFLFVSAYARRSTLLIAFLPLLVLPMLEKSLVGTDLFAEAFFVRSVEIPLFRGMDTGEFELLQGESFSFLALSDIDLVGFLTSGSLWLGLVVCGLLSAAAVYLRRYRDDS